MKNLKQNIINQFKKSFLFRNYKFIFIKFSFEINILPIYRK